MLLLDRNDRTDDAGLDAIEDDKDPDPEAVAVPVTAGAPPNPNVRRFVALSAVGVGGGCERNESVDADGFFNIFNEVRRDRLVAIPPLESMVERRSASSSVSVNSFDTGSSTYTWTFLPPLLSCGVETNLEALSRTDISPSAPVAPPKSGPPSFRMRTVGWTCHDAGTTTTSCVAITMRLAASAGDPHSSAARSAVGGVPRTRTVDFVSVVDAFSRCSTSRTQGVAPKGSLGRRGRNSVLLSTLRRFIPEVGAG